MDAPAIIARLRDRCGLTREELDWFAAGLASGEVTDAQAGAFAMAAFLNGMGQEERVFLTLAMRDSGHRLSWDLPGPVVDKHSTGGVGDCVSILLAPALAALDVYVPMISGRGLGHTGGTLDKLEAIPGLSTELDEDAFRRVVVENGAAIVAASAEIAPADRRLYAIRDVTSTVASIDLITASILSKKLAAGLQSLVLDVKLGSGAFMRSAEEARALAQSLVETANGAGCPTVALVTAMDEPCVPSVGNALEIAEVLRVLAGEARGVLLDLCSALGGELLASVGKARDAEAGASLIRAAVADGRAAERLDCIVAAQGGPENFVTNWSEHLPKAPVQMAVAAADAGHVSGINGTALGEVVVRLGGGRLKAADRIDPSVGLSDIARMGSAVSKGDPIAIVHAASKDAAHRAVEAVGKAIEIGEAPVQVPLVHERIGP